LNVEYGLCKIWLWRMPSCGMWRLVALVRTDLSEESIASIIRLKRIGELGTLVTSNPANVPSSLIRSTLKMEAIRSSETSVLTRATRRHIIEDGILRGIWSFALHMPSWRSALDLESPVWTDILYALCLRCQWSLWLIICTSHKYNERKCARDASVQHNGTKVKSLRRELQVTSHQ
jgi:hypothetical protein